MLLVPKGLLLIAKSHHTYNDLQVPMHLLVAVPVSQHWFRLVEALQSYKVQLAIGKIMRDYVVLSRGLGCSRTIRAQVRRKGSVRSSAGGRGRPSESRVQLLASAMSPVGADLRFLLGPF